MMKKKTLKLATALIATILITGLLTGCTNKEKEAVKTETDNFMKVLESGDFSEASSYCTEEVLNDTGITELENLAKVFYESLGLSKKDLSKTAQQSVNDFASNMKKNFITDYTISSVDVKDKTATVNVNVTYGYNPDELSDVDISKKLKKITSDYMDKNKTSLTKLYVDKGEKALQKKVYSDILPDALSAYSDAVKNLGEAKQELQFELKKKDGKWTITAAYSSATKKSSKSDDSSKDSDSSKSGDSTSDKTDASSSGSNSSESK